MLHYRLRSLWAIIREEKKEKERFVRINLSIRHLWLFISSEKRNPSKHTTKWCITSYYAHLSLIRISHLAWSAAQFISSFSRAFRCRNRYRKVTDSNQENGGDLNFLLEEKFLCLTKSKSFITRASNRSNLRSWTVTGGELKCYGRGERLQLGRCVSRSFQRCHADILRDFAVARW